MNEDFTVASRRVFFIGLILAFVSAFVQIKAALCVIFAFTAVAAVLAIIAECRKI